MAPTRTCVGCRTARPAEHMIRVVRLPEGELAVDRNGSGRGAWVCEGSRKCLTDAVRKHAFERALKASLQVGAGERLQAQVLAAWEQPGADVRG